MTAPGLAGLPATEDLFTISRTPHSHDSAEVHSITSAPGPHTQDMTHRMKVYALQQGLRVVCIIGVVVVPVLWVRIVLAVGAAVLPWIAVMLANRGADRSERTSSYLQPAQRPELPTTRQTREHTGASETVLDAEFRMRDDPPALPPGRSGTARN